MTIQLNYPGWGFLKVREAAAVPARKDIYLEKGGGEGFSRERNWRVASWHPSLFK